MAGGSTETLAAQQASSSSQEVSNVCVSSGMHREVIRAGQRRLRAPGLTAMERGDALQSIVWAYHHLGEYDRCIALVSDVLRQAQPGESLVHVMLSVGVAVQAAWISGLWTVCDDLMVPIEEIRQQIQDEIGARLLVPAYMSALHLAMARDDRAAADGAVAFLRRIMPSGSEWSATTFTLLAAYREDDPHGANLESAMFPFPLAVTFPLVFFTERGLVPPGALLDYVLREPGCGSIDVVVRSLAVAQALAAGDTADLAVAIDDAEDHGLIPYAARMRIVLAQLSNDRAPLEQARPVLERLGDRQFLTRLEEVADGVRMSEQC